MNSNDPQKDPVCGMNVTPDEAAGKAEHQGRTFYFCSERCLEKFRAEPGKFAERRDKNGEQERVKHEVAGGGSASRSTGTYTCPMHPEVVSDQPGDCPKCGMALEPRTPKAAASKTIYTCPMHPEIERDHPGDCPKCGMALEPRTATAGAEDDGETRVLSRKFWIGLALTVPVLFIAMSHWIPGLDLEAIIPGNVSKWIEFGLATPVVLWAGSMFFVRGWKSIVNRSLNMFTLIMVGVGAAYVYSAVAVIAPDIFPASFRQDRGVG